MLCNPEPLACCKSRGNWSRVGKHTLRRRSTQNSENIKLVAYLCLGYLEEFADKPDLEKAGWLPRLELDKVVYYDQWNGEVKDTWVIIHIKPSVKSV